VQTSHPDAAYNDDSAFSPIVKVLIVEDDPFVSAALQEMFRVGLHCECDVAPNGLTAFEWLARNHYALVVSDLRMPEMTGTEFYLWLREAQPEMAKRFVFLTGYPDDRSYGVGLADWGVPVLAKPCPMQDLVQLCRPYVSGLER